MARAAGRMRSSPHVTPRAYAPIDVVSATRTSSVFPRTTQAFSGKSTFPRGEGCYVVPLCQEEQAIIYTNLTLDDQKEHQAKQTPALATLLYVDWHNREVVRHRQVNGPPGALPPKSVDHGSRANVVLSQIARTLKAPDAPSRRPGIIQATKFLAEIGQVRRVFRSSFPR